MEGMQYIQHRVIDGVYQAVLHWKVQNGVVHIKGASGWQATDVPIEFVNDFKLEPAAAQKEVE